MTDDEALIRAVQAGDAQAFEQLLERHYDMLYRFAYKWCGNRADAEDVTQQTCLKLSSVLASYRFESAFSTWVYRVVINCAKDWARAQGRDAIQKREGSGPVQEPVSVSDGVEHQVYIWQLLHQVEALPEGIKETLLLVYAEGLTHREAASVLDVKESTVSWRLHEFRKQYRPSLDQGGLRE